MPTKSFDISIRDAERRLASTIQHKLRVVLKCYTIVNFQLEDDSFTFNKTHRIRGIKINDSKDYSGSYELVKNENPLEDKEYNLTITVN
jgi:hypothetical protein